MEKKKNKNKPNRESNSRLDPRNGGEVLEGILVPASYERALLDYFNAFKIYLQMLSFGERTGGWMSCM